MREGDLRSRQFPSGEKERALREHVARIHEYRYSIHDRKKEKAPEGAP